LGTSRAGKERPWRRQKRSWLERGWLHGSAVSPTIRATIVDWLIQVQLYLSLSDQTLHLAVANFDLILYQVDFEVEEIQLLGLVCISLAAKVEEDVPPAPDLLLPLTGGVYTKADLTRVEKETVSTLKWKLRKTSAVVFLHYYNEILGRSGKVVMKLARAILDLCLQQTWYGTVSPCHLASTVLLAASYLEGYGWPHHWAKMTGCCLSQLLASLATVLDMITTDTFREGLTAKHEKALSKIKGLGEDSIRVIEKNVKEELARIQAGSNMFLV